MYHLDHKIPISSAKTEEEIIKLNHYTNFQLLKSDENLRKSNNRKDIDLFNFELYNKN